MKNFTLLIILFYINNAVAQTPYLDYNLQESFKDYSEMEREVVYAHINKSIFVKGESIGLQAYFLDKGSKQISNNTSNAYFTISNSSGKVIKSKLVMVNNGIAVSDFQVDSLFSSGNYNVKVFTNWMRNFNEQNFFTQTIKILDPLENNLNQDKKKLKNVDAQFLGESGHILLNTDNTVGVVLKNDLGYGLPLVSGVVVDNNNNAVSTFKVNKLGVGKFIFKPENQKTYQALFTYKNKEYKIPLSSIESKGVILNLQEANNYIVLNVKTNSNTLPSINKYVYKLVVHNGNDLKESFFSFKEKKDIRIEILKEDLYKGINIFTIFDKDNNPILERQYFNYEGFNFATSKKIEITKRQDTTVAKILFKDLDPKVFNQFSVSVLPSKTKAYSNHHNLASYALLQPYVKGYIERANYYFNDISNEKKYDLDNLLITQGWSSYNWESIFEEAPDYDYDSEVGISYTATSLNQNNARLMLYPILNRQMEFATIDSENRSFITSELFPVNNEQIQIGEISATGQILKPNLKISFSPSHVPEIENIINPLNFLVQNVSNDISNNILSLNKIENLEEVYLEEKKGFTKLERLQNKSLGKVEEIDEKISTKYQTLVRYLRDKGYYIADKTSSSMGTFEIFTSSSIRTSLGDSYTENKALSSKGFAPEMGQNTKFTPLIYLDDMILHSNYNQLETLTLDQIEYIEINKSGLGSGMRGGAGMIKIKTKKTQLNSINGSQEHSTKYNIPLNFTVAKEFYVPNYSSKQSDFFNELGVIGWYTSLALDSNGYLTIKIPSKELANVKLFIEGLTNNTSFISEIIDIKTN